MLIIILLIKNQFPFFKALFSSGLGGFRSEEEWRSTLDEIGFFPISIRSDHCLSTLMLYRYPFAFQQAGPHTISSLTSATFLSVDEPSWLQACHHALQSPQIKRVFLLSSHKPSLPVLCQIFNLKKVSPDSWKLRCVFTCDSVPVDLDCFLATVDERKKLMVVDENLVMLQVIKADLFMNVLSAGKWGSLHSTCDGEMVDSKQRQMYKAGNTKYLMPQKCVVSMNNLAEEAYSQEATPIVMIHPIEGNFLQNLIIICYRSTFHPR
jgi:hypothetical protein